MAGTRGLGRFRGGQLNDGIMRDNHFDEANKINEKYIDIDWNSHRESLQDTKVDVWSQINDLVVDGLGSVAVPELTGRNEVLDPTDEGVVTSTPVEVRIAGTANTSEKDADADRIFGRLAQVDGEYTLSFYSIVNGVETPYTFEVGSPNVDVRYALRTNLAVIPTDAIINGGSGFVEGATDAQAYMNILQLANDIYGAVAQLDNDGLMNLDKSVIEQLDDLRTALENAVQRILEDFAKDTGAGLIGVLEDINYVASTVQGVLSELAARISYIETKGREEIYEAVGGENEYLLKDGPAVNGTVLISINGQIQAPGVNFEYILGDNGAILGINFAPETLVVTNGVPDVLFIKYDKVLVANGS